MSFRSRIYKVLLEQRSVLNQNFGFALGNFESRLNSIRSNVFIKLQRMFLINRLGINTFPLNVKNIQPAGLNNFQVCFNFLLKLVRFICRTVNKIQVLYSVLNTRSGRNKRQSIRNYKKRRKDRHDDNNESKQMKYVALLILCIILFSIVLLLIK